MPNSCLWCLETYQIFVCMSQNSKKKIRAHVIDERNLPKFLLNELNIVKTLFQRVTFEFLIVVNVLSDLVCLLQKSASNWLSSSSPSNSVIRTSVHSNISAVKIFFLIFYLLNSVKRRTY